VQYGSYYDGLSGSYYDRGLDQIITGPPNVNDYYDATYGSYYLRIFGSYYDGQYGGYYDG